MSDITNVELAERLREWANPNHPVGDCLTDDETATLTLAADRLSSAWRDEAKIARLEARVKRLEETLHFYGEKRNYESELKFDMRCEHRIGWEKTPVLVDDGDKARAALEEK